MSYTYSAVVKLPDESLALTHVADPFAVGVGAALDVAVASGIHQTDYVYSAVVKLPSEWLTHDPDYYPGGARWPIRTHTNLAMAAAQGAVTAYRWSDVVTLPDEDLALILRSGDAFSLGLDAGLALTGADGTHALPVFSSTPVSIGIAATLAVAADSGTHNHVWAAAAFAIDVQAVLDPVFAPGLRPDQWSSDQFGIAAAALLDVAVTEGAHTTSIPFGLGLSAAAAVGFAAGKHSVKPWAVPPSGVGIGLHTGLGIEVETGSTREGRLSQHLIESVQQITTEPWLLIQIGELRLTDGPTTNWSGQAWLSFPGIEVQGDGVDGAGQTTGSIRFANHDGSISGLLFAGGATDVLVRVWTVYGAGPHGPDDAMQIVDGLLDEASIVGEWADLRYTGAGGDARLLPRLRVTPPTFNFLPADGTTLRWGATEIVLEGGR